MNILTNLSICLSAVAPAETWWPVFSLLRDQLRHEKYPRLRLAAATTVSELVRHYIRVGSVSSQQQEGQQKEGGGEICSSSNCPEGGDTRLHEGFSVSNQQLLPIVAAAAPGASATAERDPVADACNGTWAVLTLCVTPQAEKGTQQHDEGMISETAGRTQEMQRYLRLRLSEAQDRADACLQLAARRPT